MSLVPVDAGVLRKMRISPGATSGEGACYQLCLDERRYPLNELIGLPIRLVFSGEICCLACGARTRKSFAQGYCYRCFSTRPECDRCIMAPEHCHYHAGTCRDSNWGERNCLTEHVVYLANSSGVKVGITRANQMPTRWLDQGAVQALPIARVSSRLLSGLVEDLLRRELADRTNWQRMLKGVPDSANLCARRDELFERFSDQLTLFQQQHGLQAVQWLHESEPLDFSYPVLRYPDKVKALNFDKTPDLGGRLEGIKGQYLIFDGGVINIRKFGGYRVALYA